MGSYVKLKFNEQEVLVKEKFVERYSKLTDFNRFMEYSLKYLKISIRVNTLKISVSELKKRLEKDWILEKIPWVEEGFWIKHKEDRRDIGNTLEHALGYIYVQEAASMIPPIVLNPKENDVVFDLCAAPGSKTTQIAQYMKNKGVLIANDYKADRIKPLGINVQRMGITNTIITISNAEKFKSKIKADKILVDAPCSGTGTIRKSFKTLKIWNPNMVKRLSIQQKKIIANAFNLLKEGGIMLYSTCTLEPEENEGVIDFLLNKFSNAEIMPIEINMKRSSPVLEFNGLKYDKRIRNCLRIWPQDNDTEGFFVCKIKKKV